MTLKEKLLALQTEINVPKKQYNSFGGYYYRSIDDIYEGVKPLLSKYNCVLIVSDTLEQVGDKVYIQAVATLADIGSDDTISVSGFACESEHGKMTDDQQTGTAASYARKYALGALLLLSDSNGKGNSPSGEKAETKKADTSKNKGKSLVCESCGKVIDIPKGWTITKMQNYFKKENNGKVECRECRKKG